MKCNWLLENGYDSNANLSKILEKTQGRKEQGRYYTPKDVSEYIICNALNQLVSHSNTVLSVGDCHNSLVKSLDCNSRILDCIVFDPTCGSGEFLVSSFETKIRLFFEKYGTITDDAVISIISTIKGNDIESQAISVTKIRLLQSVANYLKEDKVAEIIEILDRNFTSKDFVNIPEKDFEQYDLIIGNPPYVEDSKSLVSPCSKYGNIYANVLENSAKILKPNGAMGFVIPISYVSTSRMSKIRNVINRYCPRQLVLNYADRPDCLFQSVHQKLSILICSNNADSLEQYTSGYKYWYKDERKELLSTTSLVKNVNNNLNCIPKLGNEIELNIFNKLIVNDFDKSISDLVTKNEPNVYLSMRGYFWMKAFSSVKKSNEYRGFSFDDSIKYYMLSLLNSSLFFFYWVVVSDCWHITAKELSNFRVELNDINFFEFEKLAINLENRLEETKEYIGTKQTDYAYKHKLCKSKIDDIDVALSKVYNLTNEELDYIINYNLKYRMSNK